MKKKDSKIETCLFCQTMGFLKRKCGLCGCTICLQCETPVCQTCVLEEQERERQESLDQGVARERKQQLTMQQEMLQDRLAVLHRYRSRLSQIDPFARTLRELEREGREFITDIRRVVDTDVPYAVRALEVRQLVLASMTQVSPEQQVMMSRPARMALP